MNLHTLAPARFVRVQVQKDFEDICEWGAFTDGDACDNRVTWAIVDTESPWATPDGAHGTPGSCTAHLCADHIHRGFAITIAG